MLAKQKTDAVPCVPGGLPGGLERTRFYDGMLLTQADMEREQNFWRMKRKLTNRALGTGIVWGLRLGWDDRKRKFHLGPGYALDCCGNDLVVECPQEISERKLIDKNDPEIKALLAGKTMNSMRCPDPNAAEEPRKACIVLKYTECAGDPQPVHEDACTSNVTHCEYASVRETVKVMLAPPPAERAPTPIESFCERIDELRRACSEEPASGLFDSADALAISDFPVNIEFHNRGNGTPASRGNPAVLLQPQADKGAPATITEALPGLLADDEIVINVTPAPGHVFVGGSVQNNSGINVDPFGFQIETVGAGLLGADGPAFTFDDLQVASLFTNNVHVQADVSLAAGVDSDGTGFATATTSGFSNLPVDPGCNDRLSPLLVLNADPSCIGKTLALTALCGWFRGLLGNEKSEMTGAPNGKHMFAWWVCYFAWKALFGANLADPRGALLLAAFQDLLDEWCAAFMYPGPYCVDDHHGVYLGCVEISPKGNILCFDAWEHRRYVITGPLIEHWGSLVGLAPVDVVAGRLAGWICCLSKTQMPAITADMASQTIDGLPLDDMGMAVVAGDEAELNAYLVEHKLTMSGDVNSMSVTDLAGLILKMIVAGGGSGATRPSLSRRVYELEGTGLYVLMPSSGREFPGGGPREAVEAARYIEARTSELRPMARAIVGEYVTEIAKTVELSKLSVVDDDEVAKIFVDELERHRIVTVADYLNTGAERSARLVLANFEEIEGVEDRNVLIAVAENVAIASEGIVKSALDPFLKDQIDTEGGPMLAEHLTADANAKKVGSGVRKHLRRNALPNSRLRDIASVVAERRALSIERGDA